MAEEKEKRVKQRKKLDNALYKVYEVSGDKAKLKNRSCPKCGTGFLMANHNNRWFCGKCHYTEFKK